VKEKRREEKRERERERERESEYENETRETITRDGYQQRGSRNRRGDTLSAFSSARPRAFSVEPLRRASPRPAPAPPSEQERRALRLRGGACRKNKENPESSESSESGLYRLDMDWTQPVENVNE
jgi:hypothetical protein